jgi:hypothetical protein
MIVTKFIPASNTKGSRILVKFRTRTSKTQGATYCGYRHELSSDENHIEAARTIAKSLGWDHWVISPNLENGYVFLNAESVDSVNTAVFKEGCR